MAVLLLSGRPLEMLEVRSSLALNMEIKYCHINSLVVNEEKTKQVVFGRRDPDIVVSKEVKYLDITLKQKLT